MGLETVSQTELLYTAFGLLFVFVFFWLLINSLPKRRRISGAELMAYEQENGRLRAHKDWENTERLKKKQRDISIRGTLQAQKAFHELSGQKW
jgi:hypothetical protein